jgi:hypothetical protein
MDWRSSERTTAQQSGANCFWKKKMTRHQIYYSGSAAGPGKVTCSVQPAVARDSVGPLSAAVTRIGFRLPPVEHSVARSLNGAAARQPAAPAGLIRRTVRPGGCRVGPDSGIRAAGLAPGPGPGLGPDCHGRDRGSVSLGSVRVRPRRPRRT